LSDKKTKRKVKKKVNNDNYDNEITNSSKDAEDLYLDTNMSVSQLLNIQNHNPYEIEHESSSTNYKNTDDDNMDELDVIDIQDDISKNNNKDYSLHRAHPQYDTHCIKMKKRRSTFSSEFYSK
jgi:hypothetical protein